MANAIEKRNCRARQQIKGTKEMEEILFLLAMSELCFWDCLHLEAPFIPLQRVIDSVPVDIMQNCISTITIILFLILNVSVIFDNF